ncbi:hypothetical protein [Phenylobacterium sp.]|uniref:hypothetical protein n=1 Tax=Phenylobacterium sp. TaxID=1871053 RepID=UPI00286DC5C0|nr:hypothetical protein [Phenylobacterium sp.]
MSVEIAAFVARWAASPFAGLETAPWLVTQGAEGHVAAAIPGLTADYVVNGDVALHRSAIVEPGAVLKGPAIIGPRCLVAAGAYLRGGVFLDGDCIVGPNAELKSSFMFKGAKLAHLNFVGDSILGAGVNIEAGAAIANYRNELEDKAIRIAWRGGVLETGVKKFGALLGDETRVGANAVIAPGAILARKTRVPRLALVDQYPH